MMVHVSTLHRKVFAAMHYPESDIDPYLLALIDLAEKFYEEHYDEHYDDYDYYDAESEFYGYRQDTCQYCDDMFTYEIEEVSPKCCPRCAAWEEEAKQLGYPSYWEDEPSRFDQISTWEGQPILEVADLPLQRHEQRILNRIENSKRTRMVPVGVANWLRNL